MLFEKFEDAEAIDDERRKAIAKSIRIISVEEASRNLVKKSSILPIDQAANVSFSGHRRSRAHLLPRISREGRDCSLLSRWRQRLMVFAGERPGPLSEGGRRLMKEAIAAGPDLLAAGGIA